MPDDTPKETPSRSPWGYFGVWAFVALVVYLLSPPPAFLILEWLKVPHSTQRALVETIYAPLGYLCDAVPALDTFYTWYFHAWGLR